MVRERDKDNASAWVPYNPADPAYQKNPYPLYERLRATSPLHRTPLGMWVTADAQMIDVILNDKRFGKPALQRRAESDFVRPSYCALKKWMMFSNPPQHTKVRRLVAKGFARKRIDALAPGIAAAAGALIDAVYTRGEMEFVSQLARPLPTTVVCDLIGIPPGDRDLFVLEEKLLTRMIGGAPMSPHDLERCDREVDQVHEYFQHLMALRRQHPEEDLVSFLLAARGADPEPSDQDLAANLFLLFLAGYETTASLLGNAMVTLLSHPEQLARLRESPELIAHAVGELLRFENSVLHVDRVALEDVQIGNTRIRKGSVIWAEIAAGNRDPAVCERPETFDMCRQSSKNFSFGGGIHRCLGEYLARLEIETALKVLLQRLRDLRIAEEPRRFYSISMRGFSELHLRWSVR